MLNLMLLAVDVKGIYALAAALAIGLPAACGAFAMAYVIGKALDNIGRQPEAEGKIKTNLILGIVFIETAIIYALVISILIVLNVL